ncbi:MAG: hypothetical protein WBU92_00355, partial [Candidatus Dormiibacterota bacterium]
AQGWQAQEEDYSERLWSPAEAAPEPTNPWEVEPAAPAPAEEAAGAEEVPVWRPDPTTWEDEPLEVATQEAIGEPLPELEAASPMAESQGPSTETALFGTEEPSDYSGEVAAPAEEEPLSPFATGSAQEYGTVDETGYQPAEPAPTFSPPPRRAFPGTYETPATAVEESPFSTVPSADFEEEEDYAGAYQPAAQQPSPAEASPFSASPEPGPFGTAETYGQDEYLEEAAPALEPAAEEVAAPSSLVASPAGGSMAMGSIDARELVAGLFERWERALEQRIQAEQRLRFEAELEQRMRQVRDLRQELDQTRKAQAAQLADREREVMELRDRVRDLEQTPKRRSLFGR